MKNIFNIFSLFLAFSFTVLSAQQKPDYYDDIQHFKKLDSENPEIYYGIGQIYFQYLKEYEKEHPIKANVCRASGVTTDLMPPLSWLLKPAQESIFCGSYSSKVGTGKSYSDIYNEQKQQYIYS